MLVKILNFFSFFLVVPNLYLYLSHQKSTNTMKKILLYTFAFCSLLSCESDSTGDGTKTVENDIIDKKDSVEEDYLISETAFSIPSPGEQFDILEMMGGELNTSFLNDLSNSENYITPEKKSMNFGVYLTDVAYLMRFEKGKKILLDYISVLEKLSIDIGLSNFFNEDLFSEIEEAHDDPKHLIKITSRNYTDIYNKMLDNDMGVELSLILAGAWFQTTYIMFKTEGEFSKDPLIEELIVDQKYILENLKEILNEYKGNDHVNDMLKNMNDVSELYNKMDCDNQDVDVKNRSGEIILFGGEDCDFTKELFDEMMSKVTEIRNEITR